MSIGRSLRIGLADSLNPRHAARGPDGHESNTMIENALWPANQIAHWPIDRLVPYARNARTHTDAQIDQIAASIDQWGWTMPILAAEDGTILAGHARVLAAVKLGIAEIPVLVARGWTEPQKRAYVIADNKLPLNSAWDEDLLRIELDSGTSIMLPMSAH
jgi:hypothetical protein